MGRFVESDRKILARAGAGRDVGGVRTVIYPGSFDPITNGHLDVIERAAKLFDRVIVAVAVNSSKDPLFTKDQRQEQITEAVAALGNVEVSAFDGLLVDFARDQKSQAIIRGLRAVSDFEFEFQLALMNRKLEPNIETIFMMPRETYTFLSSKLVKEIAQLGGNVSAFVPPHVERALALVTPRTTAETLAYFASWGQGAAARAAPTGGPSRGRGMDERDVAVDPSAVEPELA